MDKTYQWRMEGMYHAYREIKENGLDSFAEELKMRQAFGAKVLITEKEMKEFEKNIIDRVQDVVLVFALAVLRDEYGFGKDRMKRFIDRFNVKCGCIAESYLTWDEQIQIIKDETGLDVGFR